jgi:hypothetical protein
MLCSPTAAAQLSFHGFGRRRVGEIIDCVERDLFTIAEGMAAGGDPKVDRPGNMEGVLAG